MTAQKDELLEIFVRRPHRYRLLDQGADALGIRDPAPDPRPFLELGCAYGDASAYLADAHGVRMVGVDRNEACIEQARRLHAEEIGQGRLDFFCGRAEELPFPDESFRGLLLEAAFSPIRTKRKAAAEFGRVLASGARVLLNDFALKEDGGGGVLAGSGIPCFQGVRTMEEYGGLFAEAGFRLVEAREEYGELITLAAWVAKSLHVGMKDVGYYLARLRAGGDDGPGICDAGNADRPGKFRITYCQMIFEKG
jgi:ubiquinone/menaquinone biosynthesis C-methylase UbiE